MPVHNAERYLREALEAVIGQTYRDLEIIISDNASTDATQAICEEFVARDPRVQYVRSPANRGGPQNFNQAFRLGSRQFFKWAAHDDLIAPDFIERSVAALEADPSAVLCFSRIAAIDDDGRVIEELPPILPGLGDPRPYRRFEQVTSVRHGGFHLWGLMRADVLADTGLHGRFPGGDKVLLAELALRGRFTVLPEPLFFLRQHTGRSVKAMPSIYLRAQWHDPASSMRFFFPHWRIAIGFFRAPRKAPLSTEDRRRCYRVLTRWVFLNWNWARLAADFLVALAPSSWRLFEWTRARLRSREKRRSATSA
jgi:glycosyltransferase involved in cell wall biosynthesis